MFCSCCASPVLFGILIIGVISFKLFSNLSQSLFSSKQQKQQKSNLLSKLFHYIFLLFSFLLLLLSIFLGILSLSSNLKSQFFASLCGKMTQSTELNPLRCGLLSNIHGRVLEFGFGPGTNFRCWENNTKIIEWVGVDPNIYFNNLIELEKQKYNLNFSTSIVWMKGENVNIEEESFDYVIATHTLCSVSNVTQVLKQISRALKSNGGKYLFFEHVTASLENQTILYYLQLLMSPFLSIVGNGCEFRELWKNIDSSKDVNSPFYGYSINISHILAPISLPPITPHIIGDVIKP